MTEALFITVGETARLLGVSDDLVYDLIHRGELPSATFGSKRMVPRRVIGLLEQAALERFDPARIVAELAAGRDGAEQAPG